MSVKYTCDCCSANLSEVWRMTVSCDDGEQADETLHFCNAACCVAYYDRRIGVDHLLTMAKKAQAKRTKVESAK